jgi:Tol biopolymer transport system component
MSERASGWKLGLAMAAAVGAAGPARADGTTERVSVGPGGVQASEFSGIPALSASGRFVAFASVASNLVPGDTNDTDDVFVRDRQTGTTRRVSLGRNGVQGDAGVGELALSADGRVVAFDTASTNLVLGDTNGETDVFVRVPRPD